MDSMIKMLFEKLRDEDKDNAQIKKLVEVLQSEEIRQFIQDGYDGAVVPTAK